MRGGKQQSGVASSTVLEMGNDFSLPTSISFSLFSSLPGTSSS